jgi:methanogenic corrinoid protein MtbC1
MNSSDTTARMTIGEVVARVNRSYPDVSHSSLRFLEREGLLRATRTAGGHRLYGPADVERICQIKAWQVERLSLDEIRRRLDRLDRLPEPAALAEEFLRLALAGDLSGAHRLVMQLDDVGVPLARLFGEVLQPALEEVGRRWERGAFPVAQEKEVSELARELVAELTARHTRPVPSGPVIVAACVEGETHELGLRMVCGLLRAHGCRVHLLGADVAPRFLLEAVQLHAPAAVLLSANLNLRLPAVKSSVEVLQLNLPPERRPIVVVGGQLAADHHDEVTAMGAVPVTGERPESAFQAILDLLPPTVAPEERDSPTDRPLR